MERSKLTKEFEEGYGHFLDKANLNHSFLDAKAIRFMNEMPGRLVDSHDALLEACKLLLETLLEAGYDPEISRVKEIADAAIAQAEK